MLNFKIFSFHRFFPGILIAVITLLLLPFILSNKQSVHAATVCQASASASFQNCLTQASAGQVNAIEVTSLISCNSSVDCTFVLSSINTPLAIYGTDSTKGFKRFNAFNYQLLSLVNSSQVSISNLTFEDDTATTCANLDDVNCQPLIYFGDNSNILVNRIQVVNGKNKAFVISNSNIAPNITVSNSTFSGVGVHSIFTYNHVVGGTIKIIGNTFQNTGSNAVALSVTSPSTNPSLVQGNTFIHNHWNTVYNTCGASGTGPCPGGQLYILARDLGFESKNVLVKGNLFQDGYLDNPIPGDTIGVQGTELDQYGLQNITVTNNGYLRNNTGIVINLQPQQNNLAVSTGLTLSNNVFNSTTFQDINVAGVAQPTLSGNVDGTSQATLDVYNANKNVNPQGSFSIINSANFSGWSCDANDYGASTTVQFYDGQFGSGGKLIGTTTANLIGTDPTVCAGQVSHSYSLAVPASIKDKKRHSIYVYAQDISTGTLFQLAGSPQIFQSH